MVYLDEADWDVTLAHNMWLADRQLRSGPAVPLPPQTPAAVPTVRDQVASRIQTQANANLPRPRAQVDLGSETQGNVEHERRAAARVLLDMINEAQPEGVKVNMSPDEVILLLYMVSWDIDIAASSFELKRARRQLQRRFDHLRKLGEDTTGRALDEQEMRDERTALLVSITGRNDWYSAHWFLARHGWNFPEAIAAWFRDGMPPKKHAHDKNGVGRQKDIMKQPLPMPPDGETTPDASRDLSVWGDVRDRYADDEDAENDEASDSEDDNDPHSQIKQGNRKGRPHGFVINQNRNPVQAGHVDPNRLKFGYISKGKYWMNRFDRDYFYFPGRGGRAPDPASYHPEGTLDHRHPVPFDPYVQRHVDELNEWLRMNYTRSTGFNIRPRSQDWSIAELDRLVALHEEQLQQLMRNKPHKSRDDLLPMVVNGSLKEAWTDTLNDEFHSGRDDIKRKPHAIITQRGRTHKLWEHYGVTADKDKVVQWNKDIAAEKAEKAGDDRKRKEALDRKKEQEKGNERKEEGSRAEQPHKEEQEQEEEGEGETDEEGEEGRREDEEDSDMYN